MRALTFAALAAGALAAAATAPALAQSYPSDTIRIIVPYRAGGGTDTIARAIAAATERSRELAGD